MNNTNNVNILLVEDSPGDVELTKEAFAHGDIEHHLDVVIDGEEAIQFLRKVNKYINALTPDLILLDLNLPRKDGFELLKEMREDLVLSKIPVVILTTSNSEMDIQKCYDLGAMSYFVKPVDLDNFFDVIKSIEEFWFTKARVSSLPK